MEHPKKTSQEKMQNFSPTVPAYNLGQILGVSGERDAYLLIPVTATGTLFSVLGYVETN